MRAFAELYDEIDTTTSTNLKVAAMARYFRQRAACRCRMGRVHSFRPQTQTIHRPGAAAALADRSVGACRNGSSMNPIRRSAIWRRPLRC